MAGAACCLEAWAGASAGASWRVASIADPGRSPAPSARRCSAGTTHAGGRAHSTAFRIASRPESPDQPSEEGNVGERSELLRYRGDGEQLSKEAKLPAQRIRFIAFPERQCRTGLHPNAEAVRCRCTARVHRVRRGGIVARSASSGLQHYSNASAIHSFHRFIHSTRCDWKSPRRTLRGHGGTHAVDNRPGLQPRHQQLDLGRAKSLGALTVRRCRSTRRTTRRRCAVHEGYRRVPQKRRLKPSPFSMTPGRTVA